jgi:hypothetical protein
LIDAHARHRWLLAAVDGRLREELAELQVEINVEKARASAFWGSTLAGCAQPTGPMAC